MFRGRFRRSVFSRIRSENDKPQIEIGIWGCLKSKVLNQYIKIGKIDAEIRIEATPTK